MSDRLASSASSKRRRRKKTRRREYSTELPLIINLTVIMAQKANPLLLANYLDEIQTLEEELSLNQGALFRRAEIKEFARTLNQMFPVSKLKRGRVDAHTMHLKRQARSR